MARSKGANSRTEKIRIRRNKPAPKAKKSKRGRVETSARQMPPVMVRGGSYRPVYGSKKSRKSKGVRRRYDIALSTPGAQGVEIRLPSVPTVRFSWQILSFLLVAGFIVLLYFMWTSPNFQVQMVDVQGALRLPTGEIYQALQIYNKPIFSLDPAAMEANLIDEFEELREVSVHVDLPASVSVDVVERVPLIAWNQDNGTKWIDGDGYDFPPRGEADKLVSVSAYAAPPKPLQSAVDVDETLLETANEPQAYMTPEMVLAILTMRSQAPADTQLVYDPQYGLGWSDSRGWDVFFGMDGDDIETKLQVYQSVVKRLESEGITPALINVEHVHAPYYRLER